jgi:hypothetical protein
MSFRFPIQGKDTKLGDELSTTTVVGANDSTAGSTNRWYSFFTLPGTSSDLYMFTAIECKNGSAVASNILMGVDVVNANPPTLNNTSTVAWTPVTAQAGTSAVQKVNVESSLLVKGGSICGAWVVSASGATAKIGTTTVASGNNLRAIAQAAPATTHQTAWTAGTEEAYVKAYYKKVL